MFAERLNFIMKLTNTQASSLGRASLLDASHISRLRKGSRPLPKNPAFLPAMCTYLAKRVRDDYQKSGLCDALSLQVWPSDEAQAASLIEQWLVGNSKNPTDMSSILNSFTNITTSKFIIEERPRTSTTPKKYYYGPEGKREAVLQFFQLILDEKTPQTLLLSSEEEMGWLYEDPTFSRRWVSDFTQVLRRGNRVKIVHNIGRDLNELLQAVSNWSLVYVTGMIEPYYYPKLRDGVCQRTLFLAPKTAAVVSTSITRKTDGMLNELITDKEALSALTLEYQNYFSLCRPLMKILTKQNAEEFWRIQNALTLLKGKLICMTGMPTLSTMPKWVAEAMQSRAPESHILELWNLSATSIEKIPEDSCYTELLGETDMTSSPIPLPCADLLGAPELCYTEKEFHAHWDNAVKMSSSHRGYRLHIIKNIPSNLLLYVKEEHSVLMAKSDAPGVAFSISEPTMTNAFWDYLAAKK